MLVVVSRWVGEGAHLGHERFKIMLDFAGKVISDHIINSTSNRYGGDRNTGMSGGGGVYIDGSSRYGRNGSTTGAGPGSAVSDRGGSYREGGNYGGGGSYGESGKYGGRSRSRDNYGVGRDPTQTNRPNITNRNTLFLHDSIYSGLNKHTLLETSISKKFTPTLKDVLDTIQSPHEDRTRILIGVGTNDIKYGQPLGYMKNSLSQIIRVAQNTYPRANIHLCGLLPSNNLDMNKIRQMNEVYNDVCCKTQHVKFIDTYSQLF